MESSRATRGFENLSWRCSFTLAGFGIFITSLLTPSLEVGTGKAIVESSSYCRRLDQLDMAPPEVHHLFHHPIADHSFSADRQTLAVARENTVELYNKAGGQFRLKDELRGHDKTVTGVDIALNTGKIVTCSQGRALFANRLDRSCYCSSCPCNTYQYNVFLRRLL